jgi:hypothetical protein
MRFIPRMLRQCTVPTELALIQGSIQMSQRNRLGKRERTKAKADSERLKAEQLKSNLEKLRIKR